MYVLSVVCFPPGVIGVVGLMMGSVVSREIANGNIGPDAVSGNMTATADYNDDQKIELASAVSFISGLFLVRHFSFVFYAAAKSSNHFRMCLRWS